MLKLEPIQEKTLLLFGKSSLKDKFYWTGGTLLSFLYLYHRRSKDLDFFADKPVLYKEVARFVQALKKPLKLSKMTEKRIYDRWEFVLSNEQNLRIEFVFYDFPQLKRRKKWKGIFVDSLDDIAANKTMALFERAYPKDLVDLYFLITKKKYTINTLLKLAEKKFGLSAEKSAFLSEIMRAQTNLDEVKPLLIAKNNQEKQNIIDGIKEYFNSRSADYLRKALE